MFSRSLLSDIRDFEMKMGHTEQCNHCRSTFLSRSDGCPNCGSFNTVSLLGEILPENYQELSPDDPYFHIFLVDKIAGVMHLLFANSVVKVDFKEGDDEYLHWVVTINGEIHYVFPGDYSLWPVKVEE